MWVVYRLVLILQNKTKLDSGPQPALSRGTAPISPGELQLCTRRVGIWWWAYFDALRIESISTGPMLYVGEYYILVMKDVPK